MSVRDRRALVDQWLGCLAGGTVGVLVVCCLGVATLLALQRPVPDSVPAAPAEYDIEAAIAEDYVNRTMETNTSGLPSPVPVIAAHLDVRRGGRVDFVARVKMGAIEPLIRGTAVLRATPEGQLAVELADVRLGFVPITALIPSSPIDEMNVAINEMVAERMGPLRARVVGVGGDETTLRFYLVADL